VSNNLT